MSSLTCNLLVGWPLDDPSEHMSGHEAAVGLGHSPASPRWGPHFREKLSVEVCVPEGGDDGRDRV